VHSYKNTDRESCFVLFILLHFSRFLKYIIVEHVIAFNCSYTQIHEFEEQFSTKTHDQLLYFRYLYDYLEEPHFPLPLIEEIEKAIQNKDVTFSSFVIQACEYALRDMDA